MKNKNQYSIEDLLDVMSELRNKCPWDQKQTFDTLKKLAVSIMERLVNKGINDSSRSLGANYVLCALTLVNIDVANALPWLYQSVAHTG